MDLECDCCGHLIEGLFPIEGVKPHSHFYNEDCDASRKWCEICWTGGSCKPCCGACYRSEWCPDDCPECDQWWVEDVG